MGDACINHCFLLRSAGDGLHEIISHRSKPAPSVRTGFAHKATRAHNALMKNFGSPCSSFAPSLPLRIVASRKPMHA